ncbi:MAG: polymer-forming cytoskeletal protein [Anaerolineae bacterium]
MHRRWLIWLVMLLAAGLLLFPATPALADDGPPDNGGITIWGEDYTLEEGERLDGDLVVFNGDVTLEAGSYAEGSVVIWNGSADVEGIIEGDLVVSGGDINLGEDARVEGDVVCTWNCDLEQEEGARVDGGIIEGIPLGDLRFGRWRNFPVPVPSPTTFWISGPERVLGWVFGAIRGVAAILVIAAVAGLVALVWPQQTVQVGQAVVGASWPSFGIGLLTAVAAVMLIVVLLFTICLSPVAVLAALALGAAGLFGWIGIGELVGERLLQALNAHGAVPLWAAGLGTLLITVVSAGLSAALCLAPLGWALIFVLGCLGLGAVVLTRFGTTAYVPSRPTSSPSPLEEAEPIELPEEEAKSDAESVS